MALPKKTKECDSVVAAYAQVCRLPTFDEFDATLFQSDQQCNYVTSKPNIPWQLLELFCKLRDWCIAVGQRNTAERLRMAVPTPDMWRIWYAMRPAPSSWPHDATHPWVKLRQVRTVLGNCLISAAEFWCGVPLEITLSLRCSVPMMASLADAVEMLSKRYCWSGTAEEN